MVDHCPRLRPVLSAVLVLLLALSALTVLPSPAAASTGLVRYVAPHGTDSGPGDSARPWRSLRHALTQLRPGDTLLVAGGEYVERIGGKGTGFLRVTPGTPTEPVTVRAVPGARPVVRGLLWLADMSHWTFDGINVTWDQATGRADEHMVRLRDGKGWTYQNSEIWGARSYANVNVLSSRAGEPANWTLRGNCIRDNHGDPSHGTARDQLLYIHTGLRAGPGLIERNLLFGAPRGKAVKLAGPSAGTGSTDVVVRYNTIVGSAKPPVNVAWATTRTRIERNLIAESGEPKKGLVHGYELNGVGNRATDNYGWGSSRFVSVDAASTATVVSSGNVLGRDPGFDRRTCDGFRPSDPTAQAYGRYAGTVAATGGEPASAPVTSVDHQGPEGSVYRLYRAYFLREPDAGGFDHWLGAVRAGLTLTQISDHFAASAEFVSRYGALTTEQFVHRVYANVLGRAPEAAGLRHWSDALSSGRLSRGGMMLAFSDSPEFRAITA